MANRLTEILKLIKFRFDVANKKIEAPIETLSRRDISILLEQIVQNMHQSYTIDERFFRIIDFFVKTEQMDINALRMGFIIQQINPRIPEETLVEIEKRLCLEYENIPVLKKKAFSNVSNYATYREDIIKKVLPTLNETEINILLQNLGITIYENGVKEKTIELLLKEGIDFDESLVDIREIYKYRQLQDSSMEKQIQFFQKISYDYESDEVLESHIKLLSPEDAIYLCKHLGRFDLKINMTEEDIIKYLYKYGEEFVNNNSLKNEISDLIYNNKEFSYERLKEIFESDSIQGQFEDREDVLNEIVKIATYNIKFNEFHKLSIDNQVKAFYDEEKLPNEVLEKVLNTTSKFFPNEFFSLIPKEDLLERFSQLDNCDLNNFFEIMGEDISNEEKYRYVKNRIIRCKNYQLLNCNFLNLDQLLEVWNFEQEDAHKQLIEALMVKMRFDPYKKETPEEKRNFLDYILQVYKDYCEKNPNKSTENILQSIHIDDVLTKEQIRKMKDIDPKLIDKINFLDYPYEYLKDLNDILYDNYKYNSQVVEKLSRQMDNDKTIDEKTRYILNIIKYFPDKVVNHRENNIANLEREEIIEILKCLNEREKNIFIKNDRIYSELYRIIINNDISAKEIFNIIDPSGKVYKLYSDINEENLEKVKSNNVIYADKKLNSVQYNFITHIGAVVEHNEQLIELKNENPNLLFTINYELLDLLDKQNLSFFSKYNELDKMNYMQFSDCRELFNNLMQYMQTRLTNPQEYIAQIIKGLSKANKEDLEKILKEMPFDKIIYFVHKNYEVLDQVSHFRFEDVQGYFSSIEKSNKRIIDNPESTIDQIKGAYLQQFFGISLDEAKDRIATYGEDVEILIKRYQNKENLSNDDVLEYNSLKQLQYLKEFLKFQDGELLRNSYYEFLNNPEVSNINYIEVLKQEENIIHAYNKEKLEGLYIPKDNDIKQTLDYEGEKISVYEPKDNWNMFISVIGAYVKNDKMSQNPYEEWNSKEKNVSQAICISAISNENLSMAISKKSIKFGFYRLLPKSIRKEASYDLASNSTRLTLESSRPVRFRTMQNIIDNVRTGHSEHLLERYEEYGGKRRQPDYIIAINKISNNDKKAAKEFGIPIVYLDTKEIAKSEMNKLNQVKKDIEEEITVESIEKLVHIYHNNYSGLITTDRRAAKKFFNPKKEKNYYISLANKINNINDKGKRLELARKFKAELELEETKRTYTTEEFIPFEFNDVKDILENILVNESKGEDEATKKNQFYETIKLEQLPEIVQAKSLKNKDNKKDGKSL